MGKNNELKNRESQNTSSSWFYVMLGILISVLIFLGVSSIIIASKGSIETVEYSDFITMVENGQVDTVQIGSSTITFTLKTDSNIPRWFYDGSEGKTYHTMTVEDSTLVERLLGADIKFGGESASILSMLVSVVLPIAFYAVSIVLIVRMIRAKRRPLSVFVENAMPCSIDAVSSLDKIPWITTQDWTTAVSHAKMDIKVIFEYKQEDTTLIIPIEIPAIELTSEYKLFMTSVQNNTHKLYCQAQARATDITNLSLFLDDSVIINDVTIHFIYR